MLGESVDGCMFYDVFAGTGIVGLEALSRGAARCVFIERDRPSINLIRRNLDHARFGPEASIRGGDAFVWSKHFLPDAQMQTIVFLGPPYPLFDEDLPRMLDLVADVQAQMTEKDILVLQFPRFVEPEGLPGASGWYRLRHYGKTRVGLWQKPGATEGLPAVDDGTDEPSDDAPAS